jgi:phospho-N-acetylmuramoyl-pentapeptide-transferase
LGKKEKMKMNLDFKIVLPIVIAFAISVVLCPIIIPFLKKLKFGQFVRDDGPESHLKKSGTPTMGGLIILLSLTITTLFYAKDYPEVLPVLFVTLAFGLIGFLDDYIKVVMKRSLGLRAWQKMLCQIVVTGVFAYYIEKYSDINNELIIPFIGKTVELPAWLYVVLLFFIVLGTVNGANLTDGLDGLASSVTLLIATFFAVVSIGIKSGVAPVTCAAIGSLLGFLVYNVFPAKVFMGDTGSLALGGFVAATAYMLKMPIFIVIVAFIYFIEVLSVILQVASFKLTGKRIFKMAPVHHHFELIGWPETKVVSIFSIITMVLCVIGLLAI